MSDRVREAFQERVAHFGRPKTLVGVVSLPGSSVATRDQAVVIVNVGVIHRVGPNRLHVQLARQLASDGFATLRFDLSGIGDSEPRRDGVVPDAVRQDLNDALSYLEGTVKATSFVLVGLCSGANTSLRFARLHRGVVGAALLDPYFCKTPGFYLRHYGRRLLRWESWRNALTGHGGHRRVLDALGRSEPPAPPGDGLVAPPRVIPKAEMEEGIAELTERGVQLLHVFTGGHEGYNHKGQFWEAFPRFKGKLGIRVEFLASADHTFRRRANRRAVIALIREWLVTTRFPRPLPVPEVLRATDGPGAVPFAS
ncbi:MAG TPA: alpha/beta fold hydrolase [Vicinamibacteria bacterium]